jgi:hypothetical protein
MHPSENKIGWQLFYKNGPYFLFQYSGVINLSENFFGCQQGNSLMKITIGMEEVKPLVFLKRLLQRLIVRAQTIILMPFFSFCKVYIVLLLEEFPRKIIPFCIIEWKYAK